MNVCSIPTPTGETFTGMHVYKESPPNMPEAKGKVVNISCFVHANHTGNVITRQSHTGIIIYIQNAPIIWFSK